MHKKVKHRIWKSSLKVTCLSTEQLIRAKNEVQQNLKMAFVIRHTSTKARGRMGATSKTYVY